jgi:hypothetical protein
MDPILGRDIENKARKMPGLGVFVIGVNSVFLSWKGAILGGIFDVFVGILLGLPELLMGKMGSQFFLKIISSQNIS